MTNSAALPRSTDIRYNLPHKWDEAWLAHNWAQAVSFCFYRHAHKRVRRPWMLFLSGQKGRKIEDRSEKKLFIINCMYFTILLAAAFVLLKYGLPMVAPLSLRL